ncbi:hypothetical protein JHK82_038352 [Glycine max]|uniref:Uncharacterized protein n=2 Tax=Glycine subgen. Soja TaxID=1462606 RepID=A0A0R0H5Y6_SOYBN|nr:hypothetical protein JHK87_038298 [Glycine soja]KAG4979060.1 hypothetical protein JHK86_038534 [Glycine max]KAG5115083.1 hypothetical protein JHK82_038352 [Glycine max]KAG5132354.1 hypothetical protein JHK84_038751 [Glycine max]KRH23634.1 hypothetical protein GLYMA_13G369600v4 [Glycine max]
MTIMTARPVVAAHPIRVSEPFVFWLTMAAAVPVNMRMKVPMNSAPTFLARGTPGGGGGSANEHDTAGKPPSSKLHSSTLKHLQLFRRDFLQFLLLLLMKPPKSRC